ncbi:hypothetical protein J7J81_00200 [bacterium]|nr:hypothetical protein [bacterium]
MLRSKCIRYVFEDNFRELLNHINNYEKETTSKQKRFKDRSLSRIKSRNYLKKFIKYFHNYAAITYSLEQHYDKFLLSFSSCTNTRREFEKIYCNPLRLFIFAVRNNITHHTVPPVSISVSHKRVETKRGKILFFSKGKFNIDRLAILSDFWKTQPFSGNRSDSKFLKNDEKRRILHSYISREYKGLSIDLKKVIKEHYKTFSNHIDNINKKLIKIDQAGYCKTENLYKKIVKRQSKL